MQKDKSVRETGIMARMSLRHQTNTAPREKTAKRRPLEMTREEFLDKLSCHKNCQTPTVH